MPSAGAHPVSPTPHHNSQVDVDAAWGCLGERVGRVTGLVVEGVVKAHLLEQSHLLPVVSRWSKGWCVRGDAPRASCTSLSLSPAPNPHLVIAAGRPDDGAAVDVLQQLTRDQADGTRRTRHKRHLPALRSPDDTGECSAVTRAPS